jgi:hypothetical protein
MYCQDLKRKVMQSHMCAMKFDSPHLDRLRIKPTNKAKLKADAPRCQWPSCEGAAGHRAPKGRGHENEYWHFCTAHAREYNQTYNYFSGMSDDAVASYQKDALTGHRPTWKIGEQMGGKGKLNPEGAMGGARDPFNMFNEIGGRRRAKADAETKREQRTVFNAERKALQVMGLDTDVTVEEIKVKFKALVKQHHPDSNGGDRSTEDRLIEIIKAYNFLKAKFK